MTDDTAKIERIRKTILERYEAESPDIFHENDLKRLETDEYIAKFLVYNADDEKLSTKQLWECLKWRKEFGVNDFSEENVPLEVLQRSNIYTNGRGVDGHQVLMFRLKTHKKGVVPSEELRKNVVYWMERAIRQENGKKLLMVLDCLDSGLANVDMEYINILLGTLKTYYPETLHYILIYEMPWIMNATFQIIKKLLNKRTVDVLKFVDAKSVRKYIDDANIPVAWGGQNGYEFEFVPEIRAVEKENVMQSSNDTNNNSVSESSASLTSSNSVGGIAKKVHFANNLSHTPPSPIDDNITSFGNEMLQITPADTIVFQKNNENELFGNVHILNISKRPVTYKVKTTAPDKFRVRPSSGTISSLQTASISVIVQKGQLLQPMNKDKFLVMSMPLPEDNPLTTDEISNLWKGVNAGSPEVEQHRLKCTVPTSVAASLITGSDHPNLDGYYSDTYITSASVPNLHTNGTKAAQANAQLLNQHLQANVNQLNETVRHLNNQIRTQQSLQWITIFVFVMISIAMVYILKMEIQNSNSQYCIDNDHPPQLAYHRHIG